MIFSIRWTSFRRIKLTIPSQLLLIRWWCASALARSKTFFRCLKTFSFSGHPVFYVSSHFLKVEGPKISGLVMSCIWSSFLHECVGQTLMSLSEINLVLVNDVRLPTWERVICWMMSATSCLILPCFCYFCRFSFSFCLLFTNLLGQRWRGKPSSVPRDQMCCQWNSRYQGATTNIQS